MADRTYDAAVSYLGRRHYRKLTDPGEIAAAFVTSPFTRLARVHACSMAGDALIAISLAGSLFFSIDPAAARWRVALYLVLTMAPFALVSPLLGPAIDRAAGGRRLLALIFCAGRCVAAILMAINVNSPLLFPEAFALLVMSKGYVITKSALVPTTVSSDAELVEANSKLALLSGVVAFAAAVPGVPLLKLGPEYVLSLAAILFFVAMLFAAFLPRATVAATAADREEVLELHSTSIVLAVSAMAALRATVGFLTFHLAFWFRHDHAPKWWFGIVLAFSAIGNLAGTAVGPIMRRAFREEKMVLLALCFTAFVGMAAAFTGGRTSAAVLALSVASAAAVGRLAFDAIVQRDAPAANRGRSFAKFETRFQLVWVAAAFFPVVIPFPGWLGFLIVGLIALLAAITYIIGQRHVRLHRRVPQPLLGKLWRELEARRRAARRSVDPTQHAALAPPAPDSTPVPELELPPPDADTPVPGSD